MRCDVARRDVVLRGGCVRVVETPVADAAHSVAHDCHPSPFPLLFLAGRMHYGLRTRFCVSFNMDSWSTLVCCWLAPCRMQLQHAAPPHGVAENELGKVWAEGIAALFKLDKLVGVGLFLGRIEFAAAKSSEVFGLLPSQPFHQHVRLARACTFRGFQPQTIMHGGFSWSRACTYWGIQPLPKFRGAKSRKVHGLAPFGACTLQGFQPQQHLRECTFPSFMPWNYRSG